MVSSAAIVVLVTLQATMMWSGAQGSCYFGRGPHYDDHMGVSYCIEPTAKLRIMLDEHQLLPTCFNCTCSASGLSCCGVGIRAGSINPPPGVKVVEDPNCGYHLERIQPK